MAISRWATSRTSRCSPSVSAANLKELVAMRPSLRVALCAVLAFASTAQAQGQTRAGAHQFSVTPRGGYIAFDKASGIENAAALGIDATYHLTPMFGIGASATFSRPKTNG